MKFDLEGANQAIDNISSIPHDAKKAVKDFISENISDLKSFSGDLL